jgi:hypothetical protein
MERLQRKINKPSTTRQDGSRLTVNPVGCVLWVMAYAIKKRHPFFKKQRFLALIVPTQSARAIMHQAVNE